jgi:1-aminocyclopropane-1-carboxylate deaminase/D-cysteine desulfhydrase-like pyridoxal-dependent ACC family enzyme
MPRLSEALGGRAHLWIKREDLGPFAFSGNKLRNLEFLLAAAQAEEAGTIVTAGRRWSNHCRLTTAAAARLGLETHLVLSGGLAGTGVDRATLNVALIRLFGGIVHEVATEDRAERNAALERLVAELRSAGRRVYVIPVGGSGALGAWGQVLGALEAIEQAAGHGFTPDAIVVPSASGGTQAGLLVGTAVAGGEAGRARVVGVIVARGGSELRPIVERIAADLATLAGIDSPSERIELESSQLGAGYGLPTDAAVEATRLLARTEGILVDPVYTAKGLAGLIALVRAGALDGRHVVFWHGGGLPALLDGATP